MAKPRSKFKKVKWLFGKEIEIPEEWEWSELGKEGNLSSGATPSRNHPEYYKGSIPWVSSGELDYNIIKYTHEAITLLAVRKTNLKIHPKDTFLFAITGLEAKGTRGRCAILGINAATNQSCMAFNESDSLSSKFLFYYFLLFGEKIIFSLAQGTKQQSLNLHLSTKIQVPIPEHKEQEKIVLILSGVNAAIEATQKVIEKTERLKKGLMQKLLTKGVSHTKFKKVKWFFGKEIKIPEEWEVTEFRKISVIKRGASPRPINDPKYFGQGRGWIRIQDISKSNKYLMQTKDYLSEVGEMKSIAVDKGDIIMSIAATVGKTIIVKMNACIHDGFIVFSNLSSKMNNEFLYYLLTNIENEFKNTGQHGTQSNINSELVSKTKFFKPPLLEQQKIASILSSADAYIQKNQEYKKKIELLKKGLMQKLLTGQIRVKVDH